MRIAIRDRNQELIDQLNAVYNNEEDRLAPIIEDDIVFECADILKEPMDAFVSPANSFGYMDGGIDLYYLQTFGWDVQTRLQNLIKQKCTFEEFLIGEALTLEIPSKSFPYMIAAPTMRMPGPTTVDAVFLSTRAAMYAAYNNSEINSVVFPGMGTGTGRVNYFNAAQAMLIGIKSAKVFYEKNNNDSKQSSDESRVH